MRRLEVEIHRFVASPSDALDEIIAVFMVQYVVSSLDKLLTRLKNQRTLFKLRPLQHKLDRKKGGRGEADRKDCTCTCTHILEMVSLILRKEKC
jgi:hypothetical protein